MDKEKMLKEVNAEIARLQSIVDLLNGEEKPVKQVIKKGGKRVTVMNPAARKRIADAQRKRWAAVRAKKKTEPAPAKESLSSRSTKTKKAPAASK